MRHFPPPSPQEIKTPRDSKPLKHRIHALRTLPTDAQHPCRSISEFPTRLRSRRGLLLPISLLLAAHGLHGLHGTCLLIVSCKPPDDARPVWGVGQANPSTWPPSNTCDTSSLGYSCDPTAWQLVIDNPSFAKLRR